MSPKLITALTKNHANHSPNSHECGYYADPKATKKRTHVMLIEF